MAVPGAVPSLAEAVKAYTDWLLVERDSSPGTVDAYQDDLGRFLRFAAARGASASVTDVDRALVEAYQVEVATARNRRGAGSGPERQDARAERIGPARRKRLLVALRSFLRWAYAKRAWFDGDLGGAIDLPKLPGRVPKALDEEPRTQLLDDLLSGDELQRLRDRALILFLLSTGCRISEALPLDRRAASADRVVVRGKGDKERVVELTERARHALAAYLAARTDPSPALFISLHRGRLSGRLGHPDDAARPEDNRLSVRGAQAICDRVGRAAGIGRFHPHQLRHTLGTMLEEQFGDPVLTADTLGHSGLGTVQTYAKVTGRRRREAYDRLEDAGL
ncbi:MAG TPA: tyrosine-type recombinase/integrase [Candidatus Dormibacteraeota bacterium]|jgi:integrase/recombinase XerD|nr:tyrosine-type recombinase/integrase [Candidatus Dormibacteraeota bacterium]